jgi:hypothetical protein
MLQNQCHVPLRNALLAVSHEQVGNLVDNWIMAMLDVTVFWQWERRHLELQSWGGGCL